MNIADTNTRLRITKGSNDPVRVALFDEHDQPEDLSLADRASLVLREYAGAPGTPILQLDTATVTPTLVIDKPNSQLVGTPTQLVADALVPGAYTAEVAVRFGSDDKWRYSDPFQAIVDPATAVKVGA